MKFEYDPVKSASNKIKHGINFDEAQLLWNDPNRLQIPTAFEAEKRYLVIGKIKGKMWTAVITYRGEATRIISVRRARVKEVALYDF